MMTEPCKQENIPHHVAIIMDGNGRWAKRRALPRSYGHRQGAIAVRRIIECAYEQGVKVLTLFALSVENLMSRKPSEINQLLGLFVESLMKHLDELDEQGVQLRFIGDLSVLPEILQTKIQQAVTRTAANTHFILVNAINYSGRWDIVQAMRQVAGQMSEGKCAAADLSEVDCAPYFCLADLPAPDLLIRTSGEQRISNFLLWQLAYTELYFTSVLWPDFSGSHLEQALNAFQQRNRRFGRETLETMEA